MGRSMLALFRADIANVGRAILMVIAVTIIRAAAGNRRANALPAAALIGVRAHLIVITRRAVRHITASRALTRLAGVSNPAH